jgi:Cu(I)/Ag(I) efflux system membrane fusion protein
MHPQIQLSKEGKCPICFMDLIPVEAIGGEELDPGQLRMTEAARELAKIETAVVRRGAAAREVRMAGKLAYDETSVSNITAWVPGRLDRLYADFTGVTVRKGARLVEVYSPELLATQEELLQAKRAADDMDALEGGALKTTAALTLQAAREKLRLLGLKGRQIEEIESSGRASENLTILAPAGGVVVGKHATEGMYVDTGALIYTITDLSRLWAVFEAYESDLPWLREGQTVEFTSPSFPGEVFEGGISFIDPFVDPATRSVGVRAIVGNEDFRLKPEMFVRGVVASELEDGGAVDGRLLVPASAPLITGTRAIVYIDVSDAEGPLFEGREVKLGPRAGDSYVVVSGLEEGDLVVTNGAFKIDSELQIQAKPSMMSPEGGAAGSGHGHGAGGGKGHGSIGNEKAGGREDSAERPAGSLKVSEDALRGLAPVFEKYFDVQMALAGDDHAGAAEAARGLAARAQAVDIRLFDHAGHERWMTFAEAVTAAARKVEESGDIASARDGFYHLSNAVIETHNSFGHAGGGSYYLTFCPMAREGEGVYWLQTEDVVWNSFYGASMLRCGEIKDRLTPVKASEE